MFCDSDFVVLLYYLFFFWFSLCLFHMLLSDCGSCLGFWSRAPSTYRKKTNKIIFVVRKNFFYTSLSSMFTLLFFLIRCPNNWSHLCIPAYALQQKCHYYDLFSNPLLFKAGLCVFPSTCN